MRCYYVEAKGQSFRYCGTNALACEERKAMMARCGLRKKDITIEDAEIPVAKNELLEFVNKLAAQMDDVAVKP